MNPRFLLILVFLFTSLVGGIALLIFASPTPAPVKIEKTLDSTALLK